MSLKVYYCGYGGNSWMAEELRPTIEDLGMELITIHEHDNADIKWDKDTWLDHLRKADIIIAPANYKEQPAKSANRLTQAMSLGKSVVCSPLQAYLDVGKKYPGSFLLADTPEEWKIRLRLLKESPSFRKQLGQKALKASADYSLDSMGHKWIDILTNPVKKDPLVSIVIPTYKNLRGLKLCIDSIRACTTVPYKIVVVNNGDDEEMNKYLSEQSDIIYSKIGKSTFAHAINFGFSYKDINPDYFMILNDDVIVSKGWLRNMVDVCGSDIGAVGLLSNCDKTWLHDYSINIDGIDLLPGTNTFEQIEPIIPQIYDYKSPYSDIIERKWVAFYATLIPKEIVDKVGVLDESFENSGEDTDYCYRINKCGYKIIQTFKSFVFHFGAVSRKILEDEDYELYHETDKRTTSYLNVKYSKPTVVIYSGPSWERWSFKSVDEGGIGGSETWQVCLARELDKLNYRVINFCDTPQNEMWDGHIRYIHYTKYPQFINENYIDYFISSRTTDTLDHPIRAEKIYVIPHDVWLLSDRNKIHLDKVTKFTALSEWHKNFISEYHSIPLDKIELTANGLDFSRYDIKDIERHPYKIFWSSSLDRGLDTLLYLFDYMKEQIPELELHIYYGMDTWEKSVKQKNNTAGLKKIEELKKAMDKPGVSYHGRVGQKELAKAQLSSSLWAYPTDFEESFCITAIEAQRAGCPVVASNYAGLRTTVGDSGILIGNGTKGESYKKEYRDKFVEECVSVLKDRDKWQHWSEKGFKNSERYSWQKIALIWEDLFKK